MNKLQPAPEGKTKNRVELAEKSGWTWSHLNWKNLQPLAVEGLNRAPCTWFTGCAAERGPNRGTTHDNHTRGGGFRQVVPLFGV